MQAVAVSHACRKLCVQSCRVTVTVDPFEQAYPTMYAAP